MNLDLLNFSCVLGLFFLASPVDSLNQLIILRRQNRTWFPKSKIWTWSLPILHFDAWHTYQAAPLMLIWIAGRLWPYQVSIFEPLVFVFFYMNRNIWMHGIFMATDQKRWRKVIGEALTVGTIVLALLQLYSWGQLLLASWK